MGNPNHDPEDGQFTDGEGGGGTGDKTTDHVLKYAASLKANMHDNAKFDQTVNALAQDKSIKTGDMRQIAKQTLGYELKASRGRTAALKAITNNQVVTARQSARADIIAKTMKRW